MDSFRRNGLTFDVRDAGPEDGEPVVLLHGFPQDSTAWDRVAPALHQHGLRTLAPDQRGYSPMARPRGRAHYRLRETVGDVLALLDAGGIGFDAARRRLLEALAYYAALAAEPGDEAALAATLLERHGAERVAAVFVRLWREGRSAPEELSEASGPAGAPAPRERATEAVLAGDHHAAARVGHLNNLAP